MRRSTAWIGPLAAIALAVGSAARGADDDEPEPDAVEELRTRLTEREDEERPEEQIRFELFGRPLIISGQYEIGFFANQEAELDDDDEEREEEEIEQALGGAGEEPQAGEEPPDEAAELPEEAPAQPLELDLEPRLNVGQELELEAFYVVSPSVSLFLQGRAEFTQDLYREDSDRDTSVWLERGEMWLYAEDIAGTNVNFEVGRLDFEDDRRWWWDEELDSVRGSYELETFDVAVAVARELTRFATNQDGIDPDQNDVLRLMGEASWQYDPFHQLDVFALRQWDGSSQERQGDLVELDEEDESDAGLTWLGLRLGGEFVLERGSLGYWADVAGVWGHERLVGFEQGPDRGTSIVAETARQSVRGWGFDGGLTWIFDAFSAMRFTLGYAIGSGDGNPSDGTDRAFRQTGVHGNEARLGGVEGFQYYGELLDPELSNLQIATVGWGISLLESSSLDLVYHHYRQVELASSLRNAGTASEPTGTDRSIGQEVDLILALEEWKHFGVDLRAGAFRKGAAFDSERGGKEYLGFVTLRYAF